MRWCSSTVKRLSLELGGNAPFIVFNDANIDQAVDAAFTSKFRNAGQTCVCSDRFIIHKSIYNEFIDKLKNKIINNIKIIGSGINNETNMGPLITEKAVTILHNKVQDAINNDGAICILGGNPLPNIGTNFYEPTILINVNINSDIWKTETFGPVISIISFDTEDEALLLANDCNVGLASYFCTKDISRVFSFSQKYVYF